MRKYSRSWISWATRTRCCSLVFGLMIIFFSESLQSQKLIFFTNVNSNDDKSLSEVCWRNGSSKKRLLLLLRNLTVCKTLPAFPDPILRAFTSVWSPDSLVSEKNSFLILCNVFICLQLLWASWDTKRLISLDWWHCYLFHLSLYDAAYFEACGWRNCN